MRVLLDTHTFIWWAYNDPSLTQTVKDIIADKNNDVFFSAASSWELAIKVSRGKLILTLPVNALVTSQVFQHQFKPLPVTQDHTYQVEAMPFHHNDPFDRILIAQALAENLIILTRDPQFAPYGVTTVW